MSEIEENYDEEPEYEPDPDEEEEEATVNIDGIKFKLSPPPPLSNSEERIEGFEYGDIVEVLENPAFGDGSHNSLADSKVKSLSHPYGYVVESNLSQNEVYIRLHDDSGLRLHKDCVRKIEVSTASTSENSLSYSQIADVYRYVSYVVFKTNDPTANSIKEKLDVFVPIMLEDNNE